MRPPNPRRAAALLLPLGVAALTDLVFLPSLHYGFLKWDDGAYVRDCLAIRALDVGLLRWAFLHVDVFWQPLTFLSLALDYHFWGLTPSGYRATNMALHALNTCLVYFLTVRLAGLRAGSRGEPPASRLLAGAAAACFFAWHPLRVESVVWIAERKDVLYASFFLAGMLFYLRENRRLGLCLGCFALALASKPMALSLPLVLLASDYYPLRRKDVRAALVEKLPFFVLAAAAALLFALISRPGQGPMTIAPAVRLDTMVREPAFYLWKWLRPTGLAPLYPLPLTPPPLGRAFYGSAVFLAAVTGLCLRLAPRTRLPMAAWLYYLATLLPAFIFVGDRVTYLPGLGPLWAATAAAGSLYSRLDRPWKKGVLLAATGVWLAALTAATEAQEAVWKDDVSLWSREVSVYPDFPDGHVNLAAAYVDAGRIMDAAREFILSNRLNSAQKKP